MIEDPHCQICPQRIAADDAWWLSDDKLMPCGHSEEHLIEIVTCSECEGTGSSEQWLSPAEIQAIRRGKVARFAFITGAFLTILITLIIVIWNSSPVEPVCGYWWYLIPPLFFLANLMRA